MDKWKKVAEILKNGGVVIIPSDSVYGIAALAENAEAVERVYKIKGREAEKPSLLIVESIEQAYELVKFTPLAENLVNGFWPGSLTLVLDAKRLNFPEQIYGFRPGERQGRTLAVRIPNKNELQNLALRVGPFILPSANLNGKPPPFKLEDIDEKLKSQADFFLDEPTDGNSPSTLVDARGEKPIIIRQGAVKIR